MRKVSQLWCFVDLMLSSHSALFLIWLQHSSYVELQNIPIRVSLFISPKILIKLFFFQSWIVHRSISIKLSLHHLCLIISPWEVHNYCHYHRYIWTSIHAFVHYCLVYLIFSIFTPWHHILVYVYFVLTMIFMIFFYPQNFFSIETEGTKWLRNVYISAESCMKV